LSLRNLVAKFSVTTNLPNRHSTFTLMSKIQKQANELLHAASKIYHYRRDVITQGRLRELEKAVDELKKILSHPETEDARLKAASDRLDALLRKIGGKIYPKTFLSDNLELALVAAILVIGVRTFFFQPFIIPTNSMYPTYSGMNTFIYEEKNDEPGLLSKAFRFVTLGARHKELIAQNDGLVQLPMVPLQDGSMRIFSEKVKGRKWFVLPAVLAEYTVLIGGVPHTIRVPAEFDMREALLGSFEDTESKLITTAGAGTGYVLDLGTQVEAGDTILRFDITLGDALFVDRLSYHFKRPDAGDPFVFRTRNIPGIEGSGTVDKYYIKRIGGVGGETLEIKEGALFADGEPRNEVEAFVRNANQEGEYAGYLNKNLLAEGRQLNIPKNSFVALGDNSANSLDSRYWGFVPEKAVIGRAIFIYFPFTKRWGLAE